MVARSHPLFFVLVFLLRSTAVASDQFVDATSLTHPRRALGCVDALTTTTNDDNPTNDRAAAVQHARIAVVVDPEDLSKVAGEPPATDGLMLSSTGRRSLAAKALRATSAADSHMAASLLATGDDAAPLPAEGGGGGANVLVIGSGGREHAIAVKLIESPRVSHVYVAPGNGGTGSGHPGVSNVADFSVSDHAALVEFVQSKGVSLVAVGPEVPLVEGVADALKAAGVPCFGPSAAAARLEGSKAYSKDFMARNGVRTARYECFTDFAAASRHVMSVDYRVVVKASGLAAGKGVLMPETKEEAVRCLEAVMVKREFGDAGGEVVVEEFLEGEEVRNIQELRDVMSYAFDR